MAQGYNFVPKINKKSKKIVEMNRSKEEKTVNRSLGPSERSGNRSGILDCSLNESELMQQKRFSVK